MTNQNTTRFSNNTIFDHNNCSYSHHSQQQKYNNTNDNTCNINDKITVFVIINCLLITLIVVGNIFILNTLLRIKSNFRRNIDLFITYLAGFDLLATLMITGIERTSTVHSQSDLLSLINPL